MNLKNGKTMLIGVALLCTGALAGGRAVADDAHSDFATVKSIRIPYHRDSLEQPKAAELLYRQIRFAARRVCNEPEGGPLTDRVRFEQCYNTAVDNAVESVNATALTALHRRAQHSTAS
jgi:UrcA family protein